MGLPIYEKSVRIRDKKDKANNSTIVSEKEFVTDINTYNREKTEIKKNNSTFEYEFNIINTLFQNTNESQNEPGEINLSNLISLKNNSNDKKTDSVEKSKVKPQIKKKQTIKQRKSLQKILEENEKLKHEISRLKDEKKLQPTSIAKNKPKIKKCKLLITDEEKYSLALDIAKLSLENKIGLKPIIKNHMALSKPGEINFSLDKLPALVFKELQQYVRACLKNAKESQITNTIEPLVPLKIIESNENNPQLINIKRSKSIFDDDEDLSESLSSNLNFYHIGSSESSL
jgi:hypothetical protein